ncbi:hypothetical protein HY990_05995 [Candidatus Micrarchaeota archaeon]|nr:hypothetical protein [Candidatus Micrarchaeota archaeon]
MGVYRRQNTGNIFPNDPVSSSSLRLTIERASVDHLAVERLATISKIEGLMRERFVAVPASEIEKVPGRSTYRYSVSCGEHLLLDRQHGLIFIRINGVIPNIRPAKTSEAKMLRRELERLPEHYKNDAISLFESFN